MNAVLDRWNKAEENEALSAMIACCGARRWAEAMVALRPMANVVELSLDVSTHECQTQSLSA